MAGANRGKEAITLKKHVICIQEAYALFLAMGREVPKTAQIRPPYPKCILSFKPDDSVVVLSSVNWIANQVEIESYKLHDCGTLVHFMSVKMPDSTQPNSEITFACDENYHLIAEEVIGVTSFALNLMNCNNIKYIPFDPNKLLTRQLKRQRERAKKSPYLKYEILEIQPMRERTITKGSLESKVKNNQRLHTVRGHFKSYTIEKPLFGKITGTFWWGDCVKGNAEIGLLEKDYCIHIDSNIVERITLGTWGDAPCFS